MFLCHEGRLGNGAATAPYDNRKKENQNIICFLFLASFAFSKDSANYS